MPVRVPPKGNAAEDVPNGIRGDPAQRINSRFAVERCAESYRGNIA